LCNGTFETIKKVYHITSDEYRKSVPMLNTFDKPELSSRYIMIDENVPLIVGNIVLEIQRKALRTRKIYFGF
jgi:AraC family transcriptional regulator